MFGCKERGTKITVFDGLQESTYLSEAKSLLENKKPLIVTFLASWCPHCSKYRPILQEIKDSFQEEASFLDVDVDSEEGSSVIKRFHVRGIPTTAFIRTDGSVFKIHAGVLEKDDLTEIVSDLIKSKKKKRREPVAPFPIETQVTQETEKEIEKEKGEILNP